MGGDRGLGHTSPRAAEEAVLSGAAGGSVGVAAGAGGGEGGETYWAHTCSSGELAAPSGGQFGHLHQMDRGVFGFTTYSEAVSSPKLE